MNSVDREKRDKAVNDFLTLTVPKSARLTLMKLYFCVDKKNISKKDEEEVYLLYNLLEKIE